MSVWWICNATCLSWLPPWQSSPCSSPATKHQLRLVIAAQLSLALSTAAISLSSHATFDFQRTSRWNDSQLLLAIFHVLHVLQVRSHAFVRLALVLTETQHSKSKFTTPRCSCCVRLPHSDSVCPGDSLATQRSVCVSVEPRTELRQLFLFFGFSLWAGLIYMATRAATGSTHAMAHSLPHTHTQTHTLGNTRA